VRITFLVRLAELNTNIRLAAVQCFCKLLFHCIRAVVHFPEELLRIPFRDLSTIQTAFFRTCIVHLILCDIIFKDQIAGHSDHSHQFFPFPLQLLRCFLQPSVYIFVFI